jgi:membrane-associated HD superfamily phosphohydrolase
MVNNIINNIINNNIINNNKYFIKSFKLIFVTGIISWCTISIIALANENNNEIRAICEKSNLWSVLITVLMITIILTSHFITYDLLISKYNCNIVNKKIFILLAIIIFLLVILSCIELYNNCSKKYLVSLILYKCLSMWVYLLVSCFILLIINLSLYIKYIYYDSLDNDQNNYIIDDNIEFNNNNFVSPWDIASRNSIHYVTI